jgi:O-glycosyl hydrolase
VPASGGTSSGGSSSVGGQASGGQASGGLEGIGGVLASGGASSGGGSGGGAPRPIIVADPGTSLLRVELDEKRQLFEGWGTSMCWWADRVGRWGPEGIGKVADALLDDTVGLGFNIFRYNIGGGENPDHDHMDQYKDIEGFQAPGGAFDWEADPYQRAVLDALVARNPNLILEAFSNSPPYWMTESGCASGSASGSNNLKADQYEPFAHYLTEVVRHFKDTSGIVFRTLEPLNEPNASWWKSGGGQEGCHFSPVNQQQIIAEVQAQLELKGLTGTVVSAADENSIDDAITNLNSFSQETIDAIGQVNVHSYSGSKRKELRALATELGKRLWQSESGPLSVEVADDIEAALFMGGRIMSDMTDLGAEAWLDWQVGDVSVNWASITLSDQDEDFVPRKRFYVQAAFSRFIRPGAQILAASESDVLIALNEDGQSLVLVLRSGELPAPRSFTLDLTELPSVGTHAQVYRTSRTEDLVALPDIPIDDFSAVVNAPANSLTTVVVPVP